MYFCSHVQYWEKFSNDKKKKFVQDQCFRLYSYNYSYSKKFNPNLEKIFYKCPIDENISPEELSFFLNFVRAILPSKTFKSKRFKNNILYVLDCKNLVGTQKILFILTLCRILEEMPEIVKSFYDNRTNSLPENFLIFQKSHNVKLLKHPYAIPGHAVKNSNEEPVSYKKFVSRWNDKEILTVLDFMKI